MGSGHLETGGDVLKESSGAVTGVGAERKGSQEG